MADIELIVKIDEETYNNLKIGCTQRVSDGEMIEALKNGIPLPKRHGRLKDIDWIDDNCPDYRTEDGAWCYKWEDIDNAPTIIEADKGE